MLAIAFHLRHTFTVHSLYIHQSIFHQVSQHASLSPQCLVHLLQTFNEHQSFLKTDENMTSSVFIIPNHLLTKHALSFSFSFSLNLILIPIPIQRIEMIIMNYHYHYHYHCQYDCQSPYFHCLLKLNK